MCVCDNSVPYLTEGITVGSEPTPALPQEGVCIEVRFFIISLNLLSFSGHGRTPSGLRSTFTPACGFRCTRLVRLHQSLVNLHRSPAVEGEQVSLVQVRNENQEPVDPGHSHRSWSTTSRVGRKNLH